MAFRRVVRVKESRAQRIFKRVLWVLAALITLTLAAALLFINGDAVKEPLARLISARTGSPVTIESAEFSPLYPQVIRLQQVKLGDLQAGEIYAEYSLPDLLVDQRLHFYDLYIKDADFTPEKLKAHLAAGAHSQLPAITADLLRLNSIPLAGRELTARDAKVRLYNAALTPEGTVTFASGHAQLTDAVLSGTLPCKALQLSFTPRGEVLEIPELQAETLGGSVTLQDAEFNPHNNCLAAKQASAARLVLRPGQPALPFDLKLASGFLSGIYAENAAGFNFTELSGSFNSLLYKDHNLSANFELQAAALAYPGLQLTMEDTVLKGALSAAGDFTAEIKGQILEGTADLDFTYAPASHELTVRDAKLSSLTLELHRNLTQAVSDFAAHNAVTLINGKVSGLKFLSFIPTLPLSIESLDLQVAALHWEDGQLTGQQAGLLSLSAHNLLYADLLVPHIMGLTAITPDLISFSIPELKLRSSALSLAGALSFNQAPSYLILNAPQLALDDLNCSLIQHLLQGRLSLQADLRAPGPMDLKAFPRKLSGSVRLSADEILISALGLDLINGGELKTQTTDLPSLMAALQAADTGIYQLKADGTVEDSVLNLKASARTPASEVTAAATAGLTERKLDGAAVFTSLPGDSITEVKVSGPLSDPQIALQAVKRGEPRPGLLLNLPAAQGQEPKPQQPAASER